MSVLVQDKPAYPSCKPNVSESGEFHASKTVRAALSANKPYSKPAKKPVIPSSYEVLDDLFEMDKLNYKCIQMKDVTHALTRLKLTDTLTAAVEAIFASQEMPSWSAFNTMFTEENVPEKVVGFQPVLPHPVADYDTVLTAMHNLLSHLSSGYIHSNCFHFIQVI